MAGVNNRVKSTNDLELKDRLVAINRVTKVTKGGRTFSFAAIVVVGNEDGIVGWGLGKAGEVTTAIAKGVEAAKKKGMKVVGLLGKGGGKLKDMVDVPLIVESNISDRIQEVHIKCIHIFIEGIERAMFPENY